MWIIPQLIFCQNDSRPCQFDSLKLLRTPLRLPQAFFGILRIPTPCTIFTKPHPKRTQKRDRKGMHKALNRVWAPNSPSHSRMLELWCSLGPQRLLPGFCEKAYHRECMPLTAPVSLQRPGFCAKHDPVAACSRVSSNPYPPPGQRMMRAGLEGPGSVPS